MSTPSSKGEPESMLFVVRESGRDISALESLLHRTLRLVAASAGIEDLQRNGMKLLSHPDDRCQVVAATKDRGVLINAGDVDLLLYQGSANMKSGPTGDAKQQEENRFNEILRRLLAELRPSLVVVVEVSRLARRTDYFETVLTVLADHSCEVRVAGRVYDPRVSSDRDDLKRQALSAENERNITVDRTTAGALSRARIGKWPNAENLLPLGYRLDEAGYPVVDLAQVDMVRAVIDVLCKPGLTSQEIVVMCGRLGVPAPGVKVRKGGRLRRSASIPTVADARNPSEVVNRLRRAAAVWLSGKYAYVRRCSSTYTHEIDGVPVTVDPVKGRSFHVDIRMPAPAGGWADPESLREAANSKASPRGRPSQANQQSLFSHIPAWIEDGIVHTMLRQNDRSVLKSRPALPHEQDGGEPDKIEGGTGIHQFSVQSSELLISMVGGIANGLQAGVEGVVFEGVAFEAMTSAADAKHQLVYRSLSNRVADLHRELGESLHILGRLDEGSRSLEIQKKTAERLAVALNDAQAELQMFDTVGHEASSYLSETTQLNLAFVARALAVMGSCTGMVERQAAVHVARLFTGFRLRRVSALEALWECWIRVPTSDGVAEIGPFRGPVRICAKSRGPGAKKEPSVARSFMCDGHTLGYVAAELGVKLPSAVTRMKTYLRERGFVDGMLAPIVQGMPPYIRQALAYAVDLDDDQGYDAEWIEMLRRTYLVDAGQKWSTSWENPLTERQEVLDRIASNGGVLRLTQIDKNAGLLNRWARDEAVPATHAVYRPTRQTCEAILSPRVCPHCGSDLTRILRVPELTYGLSRATALMCSQCRRAEGRESPVLPAVYFLPDLGEAPRSVPSDRSGLESY